MPGEVTVDAVMQKALLEGTHKVRRTLQLTVPRRAATSELPVSSCSWLHRGYLAGPGAIRDRVAVYKWNLRTTAGVSITSGITWCVCSVSTWQAVTISSGAMPR